MHQMQEEDGNWPEVKGWAYPCDLPDKEDIAVGLKKKKKKKIQVRRITKEISINNIKRVSCCYWVKGHPGLRLGLGCTTRDNIPSPQWQHNDPLQNINVTHGHMVVSSAVGDMVAWV